MSEFDETAAIVERLQAEFEGLVVRGLRAAGPENLRALENLREEFARVGAAHLAGRIETLLSGLRSGDRSAAAALMRAQASLRLFDRILSTRAAAEALGE